MNSGESTKDKIEEVEFIIDSIGTSTTSSETGIININARRRADPQARRPRR